MPFAKICRYRATKNDLLVTAGCGWNNGVVGYVVSAADESSTQGRAFVTGKPVILEDVAKNHTFTLPAFYAEHGIAATVGVPIKGRNGPWGVLEVDSPVRRKFDRHDIDFLTGFANVVAEAVAAATQIADLKASVGQKAHLLAQKEELLAERDKRELHLHGVQAELLHVSRLNAMGEMTSAIAHELNQPLTAILNYLGAMRRLLGPGCTDMDTVPRVLDAIRKATAQTARAGDVIKNLRKFVEKRESTRKAEDISDLIAHTLTLVNYDVLKDGIAVTLRLDASLPRVMVDAVQVQQVLINLIRNGMEAMRPQEDRRLLVIAQAGAPGFVDVTIQDNGPGLPDEIAARLFQPFVTSRDKGMGMGLTICDVLVRANGGRIRLVDGLAQGTGFCFSLPLAAAG